MDGGYVRVFFSILKLRPLNNNALSTSMYLRSTVKIHEHSRVVVLLLLFDLYLTLFQISDHRLTRSVDHILYQHFCPSFCTTAPIVSAPFSQCSAILTSLLVKPRGLWVVQYTSTDPILFSHFSIYHFTAREDRTGGKGHTTVITAWCFCAALSAAITLTNVCSCHSTGIQFVFHVDASYTQGG